MSRSLLGQIAYESYTGFFPLRLPTWQELTFSERLAWGHAARAAVVAAHAVPCERHVEIETEADLWRQARRKTLRHDKAHAGPRAPKGAKSKRLIKVA